MLTVFYVRLDTEMLTLILGSQLETVVMFKSGQTLRKHRCSTATPGQLVTLYFSATQRVSQVLWNQLDTERREQHVSCVELFYRLHCLAPSSSICEDIICQALMHKDKVNIL